MRALAASLAAPGKRICVCPIGDATKSACRTGRSSRAGQRENGSLLRAGTLASVPQARLGSGRNSGSRRWGKAVMDLAIARTLRCVPFLREVHAQAAERYRTRATESRTYCERNSEHSLRLRAFPVGLFGVTIDFSSMRLRAIEHANWRSFHARLQVASVVVPRGTPDLRTSVKNSLVPRGTFAYDFHLSGPNTDAVCQSV